jgi:hypothetical protein
MCGNCHVNARAYTSTTNSKTSEKIAKYRTQNKIMQHPQNKKKEEKNEFDKH